MNVFGSSFIFPSGCNYHVTLKCVTLESSEMIIHVVQRDYRSIICSTSYRPQFSLMRQVLPYFYTPNPEEFEYFTNFCSVISVKMS